MKEVRNPAFVGASPDALISEREREAVAIPTMNPASAPAASIGKMVCEGAPHTGNIPRDKTLANGHATAAQMMATVTITPRVAFGEVILHTQLNLPKLE
jgi:hypothetical protein